MENNNINNNQKMKMKDVKRLQDYSSETDLAKKTIQNEILKKESKNKNLTLNFKGNKKVTALNNNPVNYFPNGVMYDE